jgi:hypothetical protein
MSPTTDQEIHAIDRRMVAVETEMKIQFKELFTRIKRLEWLVLIGGAGVFAFLFKISMQLA